MGASDVARAGEPRDAQVRSRPSPSLAFKLALLAVAPFAVLSTVLLLGVTYQFERLAEMTIGNQEMEFSTPVVQAVEAAIRNAHESLGKAAIRLSRLPTFDEPSLRQALEREDQLLLLFSEGLQVADANAQVLASIGPVRRRRDEQAGYSFPAPAPNTIVSLPFEALSARAHPAAAQTVPIVVDGQIRGYLSGASDLFGPRYLGPYRNTRFGTLGYFSLTTPNRILFLHKDPKRILHYGGPPGLNRAIDRGLQGWEGWMNTKTAAGPMITAIRQIPSSGWILSVHYPKTVAQAPFLTARRDLVLAVSLGAAVLLGIVVFLSRRMLRPLLGMKRQVEALTEGTSDVPLVPIRSGDEIGVLSNAFNRLVRERSVAEKELRASEERFRRVVRNVPVVQWALDNQGVFTLAEGLGLLSLGHRSERIVGSNLFELYADNARILRYFGQAREGRLVSGPFEQGAAAFDSHWGPLRDESGCIVGVTAIALDVTERQRAELARRESELRMGVLERLAATGRLAAGVAHEINNPLTYVVSNLEDIRSQPASAEGMELIRRCADEAMDGAARVAAIVRDLRAFSGRPQQGQPRCQPLKVAECAVALMRNQIRHRARLEVDCQATPEAAIEDGRFTQVLVNLLMNACQAIPEGNVEGHFVRLQIRYEPPWILARVSDSGEGIDPEVTPHLFEPFFTTRMVGEGSGLGLSVSFAIVTEVGGTIEVQSPPGEGAKFVVKLPVAEAAPARAPEPEPEPARADSARRLRLLVIDDEPLVGRAVARHLREHDVAVECRAQTALERLRTGEQFDAILTDVMMPEMSGIQFYEQLRCELPEPSRKVIFMSGGAFGPEARAFMAGAKQMVYEKPLDLPLLSAHLRRLAERKENASERVVYGAAPTDSRDAHAAGADVAAPGVASARG